MDFALPARMVTRLCSLVVVVAASLSLAGCGVPGGGSPEGCGHSRVHDLDKPSNPVASAQESTQGSDLVYLWKIQVTGACRNEHVEVNIDVQVDEQYLDEPNPDDNCADVSRIIGSAYMPGSFITPRPISMSGTMDFDAKVRTYHGTTSYGLQQFPGAKDSPASYTVDVEVHYPTGGDETAADQCASLMVKSVKIRAVDRIAS